MKQDSGAVVSEAAETAGVGLDGLHLGVEALGQRIGDRMQEVVEQSGEVGLEGGSDLLDRFELGAAGGKGA